MGDNKMRFVQRFPEECCAEVTRKGEAQPCGKTAVAVAVGADEDSDHAMWWPVCAYHTRKTKLVPLTELLFRALR